MGLEGFTLLQVSGLSCFLLVIHVCFCYSILLLTVKDMQVMKIILSSYPVYLLQSSTEYKLAQKHASNRNILGFISDKFCQSFYQCNLKKDRNK